jgi:choline dehydrogenase-like flavoprotein
MSFNMGAPVTAEFDQKLDAYAGLQISHYGIPLAHRGFVFETWYNPPVAQAINMPGWFEEHFENMLKYDRLMAVGVLVGTESNAWIRQALTGGPGIEFKPTQADLHKLGDGLAQVSDILFKAGATRLLLNTWGEDQLTHPNQIPDIYRIVSDPSYLTLGTGHPQGGNAISADPSHGVVDERFRVHGYANLHVCDASVFPTSITVNPQLTVMALAHYAAARMAS